MWKSREKIANCDIWCWDFTICNCFQWFSPWKWKSPEFMFFTEFMLLGSDEIRNTKRWFCFCTSSRLVCYGTTKYRIFLQFCISSLVSFVVERHHHGNNILATQTLNFKLRKNQEVSGNRVNIDVMLMYVCVILWFSVVRTNIKPNQILERTTIWKKNLFKTNRTLQVLCTSPISGEKTYVTKRLSTFLVPSQFSSFPFLAVPVSVILY